MFPIRVICLVAALGALEGPIYAQTGSRTDASSPAAKESEREKEALARAVAFLSREVRQWPVQNKCFSCHNNGDAARVLYMARRSVEFDGRRLETTTAWLSRPGEWKKNAVDEAFSDKKLAAIQFAFALAAAVEAGIVGDKTSLRSAAELVREQQEQDGSWKVDADALPGSPATYGRTLSTVAARRVLATADDKRFAEAVRRAETWLKSQRPRSVLDSAAVLIGLQEIGGEATAAQRGRCLAVIRKGQSDDGGFGPYVNSQPEVFDTAVVLLGLATLGERSRVADSTGIEDMIRRGRRFLIKAQLPDGSWPETTRPTGVESYAQRISTTAWATQALLVTQPRRERK